MADERSKATFYVKFPPNGDATYHPPGNDAWALYTYGTEAEYAAARLTLDALAANWDATGNPLYLLEAYRVAVQARLYPPLWVLNALLSRFNTAFKKGTKASLDTAFGLSGKGLGKGRFTTAQQQDATRNRDRILCLAVFKLQGAGLTRWEACKALSSKLGRMAYSETIQVGSRENVLRRMDVTTQGLKNIVAAAESYWAGERDAAIDAGKNEWTDAEKRKMLSIFDPSELPKRIRTAN